MGPLLVYLRRHLRAISLGVVFLTLCNIFELVQPRIWKGVVDALQAGTALPSTILTGALLLVAAGLGRSVFSFLQRWLLIGTSRRIEYDIRNDFFRHLQKLPPSYYVTTKTGDLMSRATSDINAVRMLLGLGVMLLCFCLFAFGLLGGKGAALRGGGTQVKARSRTEAAKKLAAVSGPEVAALLLGSASGVYFLFLLLRLRRFD